jgi:hypothetical protein
MVLLRRFILSLVVVCPLFAHAVVPERPVSDARIGIASTSAPRPLGASNGTSFLVVWTSLDRGGQALLLDAEGHPVYETAVGLPFNPRAVYWNDDAWYVIGESSATGRGWVRVDAEGMLLDREPHPLAVTGGTLEGAVWAGDALIAIVTDFDQATHLSTARAVVLDAALEPKATHTIGTWPVSLLTASDDETALVAFYENGTTFTSLHAVLFSREGDLLVQRELKGLATAAAIGTRGDGSGYLIVTKGAALKSDASFAGFHLDHQLIPQLTPTGFGSDMRLWACSPTASWDGSAYTFFYMAEASHTSEIRMARLDGDGKKIDDGLVMDVDNHFDWQSGLAGVAGMGRTLFLHRATLEPPATAGILRMRTGADAASVAASPILELERGAFQQTAPVVASSATQALVVWNEHVGLTTAQWVYASRVDAAGNVRDPQSIYLGTSTSGLAVASDGENFLVGWHDTAGIRTALIGADGTIGATTLIPLVVSAVPTDPVMACLVTIVATGSGYVVAWSQLASSYSRGYAVRLHADGTAFQTFPASLGSAVNIAGASDGTNTLLAWGGKAVLINANGFIGATLTLGGDGTKALWWNGSAYTAVQEYWPNQYALVSVSPFGGVTAAAPQAVVSAGPTWGGTWRQACDTSGCSAIQGTVGDGRTFLREVRATADGVAGGKSVEVAPVLLRDRYESMSIAPFRLPGGRLYAAFTRNALDVPYAGISRIFLVSLQSSRTRAARH